jgi:hypothetical protein
MSRLRSMRQQRTPIFIGCEGQSEMRYAGWLRNLVIEQNLPFHLVLEDLGCGGEPFKRVDMAIARVKQIEKNKERFFARYLFLDTDQLAANSGRADQARRLAFENKFTVIWQDPTHEAFLLRHFPRRDTHCPPDKRAADVALAREWADYRKPCSAQQLEQRLSLDGAVRVAKQSPELAGLLRTIGLCAG